MMRTIRWSSTYGFLNEDANGWEIELTKEALFDRVKTEGYELIDVKTIEMLFSGNTLKDYVFKQIV